MSIEEAEYVLNEAVITQSSISSYTYISAEEINQAIGKLLENKLENEKRIKELEKAIMEEEKRIEFYPVPIYTSGKEYLKKIIKYIKKVLKPFMCVKI